jgi:ubiquinone/menaquinone biosynthesis C-methylase UbiE
MRQTWLTEFGKIDQTADPAVFIGFLDAACAEASFQAYKRRLIELLEVGDGKRFLDLGCGTGDDACAMARLVGASGRVVGVDNSRAMIAEAERRAAATGLPVEFHVADGLQLPFPAASFDGCQADRSLMHVPDPRQVLAEMARVTRPGGRVVVFEVDFGTVVLDTPEREAARKLIDTWCDSLRDGWLGRRMPRLFRDVGLEEVGVLPHTLTLTPPLALPILGAATVARAVERGTLTPMEGQSWLDHLGELERSGQFFSTLTGYLVVGRRGPCSSGG